MYLDKNLMETMNVLITSRLFSGLETSAPVALLTVSSALTLSRFCNFVFNLLHKTPIYTPDDLGNTLFLGGIWFAKNV